MTENKSLDQNNEMIINNPVSDIAGQSMHLDIVPDNMAVLSAKMLQSCKYICKGNLCRHSTLKQQTGKGGSKVRVRNYVHHSDIPGKGGSKEKTLRNPFAQ